MALLWSYNSDLWLSFANFSSYQNHLEDLFRQTPGPHPRVSDSVGLGWEPGMCVSNYFLEMFVLVSKGQTLKCIDLDCKGGLDPGSKSAFCFHGHQEADEIPCGWKVTGECLVCLSHVSPSGDPSFFISFPPSNLSFSLRHSKRQLTAQHFLKKRTELPATWGLGQRESWGFVNYLGSLSSSVPEFC